MRTGRAGETRRRGRGRRRDEAGVLLAFVVSLIFHLAASEDVCAAL